MTVCLSETIYWVEVLMLSFLFKSDTALKRLNMHAIQEIECSFFWEGGEA